MLSITRRNYCLTRIKSSVCALERSEKINLSPLVCSTTFAIFVVSGEQNESVECFLGKIIIIIVIIIVLILQKLKVNILRCAFRHLFFFPGSLEQRTATYIH